MVKQVRARSEEAKLERRSEILAQARRLATTVRYPDLTLQQVAEQVGLSKPALYAYFPTKEELFLSLTQQVLGEWLAALEQHLRLGARHTPGSLAGLMVTLLRERPELMVLMPLLSMLFERNIGVERARDYKHWLVERAGTLATLLEQALPGLPPGAGWRLLTYTQALIAGLQPMSDPAASVQQVLDDPQLKALRLEFLPTLQDALTALCRGLVEPQ
ncbi:TetR/AcrR family transcriptional regulator [Deinococcus sonorensis]|uniref:TetR family transcriptional regulator n=2 Tax=Deinococcus sonorensis TaxID=309891 RepID=A0AAU7U846_9DEIO